MSSVIAPVLITPWNQGAVGSSIELPTPEDISYDQARNVTFNWADPLTDHRAALTPLVAREAQQARTRGGAYVVVADMDSSMVRAQWSEYDPWSRTLRAKQAYGVLTMPSYRVERRLESFTLVLYLAQDRYPLGGGSPQSV